MYLYQADMTSDTVESLFNTAIYRFIELNSSSTESEFVAIHTEIRGSIRRKVVTLWSAEAVDRFDRHWREFQRERADRRPF